VVRKDTRLWCWCPHIYIGCEEAKIFYVLARTLQKRCRQAAKISPCRPRRHRRHRLIADAGFRAPSPRRPRRRRYWGVTPMPPCTRSPIDLAIPDPTTTPPRASSPSPTPSVLLRCCDSDDATASSSDPTPTPPRASSPSGPPATLTPTPTLLLTPLALLHHRPDRRRLCARRTVSLFLFLFDF